MADVSHRGDITGHPDAMEMRERYSRMLHGRDVALVDGPIFLVGLYLAVSPWVVDYTTTQPALTVHALVVGIAIGLLALGFTARPERMAGLSLAMSLVGVWVIISTWVVGSGPTASIIVSNCIIGGLTFVLGLLGTGASVRSARKKASASSG
ncbi:SPW repeat protein [Streptomyces sp. TR06-5]|uniref:SPW repeat protein n=1 Tax=unclassified Streptomyces TaxID=2593676 RepID=UPI00399FF18E